MRYGLFPILVAVLGLTACAGGGSKSADTGAKSDTGKTSSSAPASGGKLYVQSPAVYDKNSGVIDKIRDECKLEIRVPKYIEDNAKKSFDVVPSKTLGEAGANKALSLTITQVLGYSGGAWSGPKGMTVKGVLKQGGKVLGSFEARRTSTGGMWGGYKSTCGIFDRDAESLGKDIGAWLASPTMNARLGELAN